MGFRVFRLQDVALIWGLRGSGFSGRPTTLKLRKQVVLVYEFGAILVAYFAGPGRVFI